MEFRVLKYFLAVANEESISGAAQSLNVTQPTLSRQLMDLEQELGKQLFIRGNRKIKLTEEGMILRKRAEEIVSLVNKTESEIMLSEDNISGDVYIGCGETNTVRIIAKTAKALQNDDFKFDYHFFSGNAFDVIERLEKGLIDFGLFIGANNLEKYNTIRLPVNDTWGLLMRKDSPLADKDAISYEDLHNIPLIVSEQAHLKKELSDWFKTNNFNLKITASYNLLYNASLMVDEGLGYALTLDNLMRPADSDNLCFRPLKPKKTSHIDIAWKKYQALSKPAEIFLNKLQELYFPDNS